MLTGISQYSLCEVRLTVDDLAKVCEALYSIQDKWRDLALQLGVPVKKLDRIKTTHPDAADCLRETVKEWLTSSPSPTWQILTSALRSPIVHEHELALRLELQYCHCKKGTVPISRAGNWLRCYSIYSLCAIS